MIRTTRQSLDGLLAGYDLTALADCSLAAYAWLTTSRDVLAVRTQTRAVAERGGEFFTAFDPELRPRLQFALPETGRPGYIESAGSEQLAAGLRLTQWDGHACDLPIPAVSGKIGERRLEYNVNSTPTRTSRLAGMGIAESTQAR